MLTFAGTAKRESKHQKIGMTRKKNLVCGSEPGKAINADLAVSDSAALGMCVSGLVVLSCLHFVYADTPGSGKKKKAGTRSSAAKHAPLKYRPTGHWVWKGFESVDHTLRS